MTTIHSHTNLSSIPNISNQKDEVRETKLRRQLNADINEIQFQITSSTKSHLTEAISDWLERFDSFLKHNKDEQEILDKFLPLVESFLKDPITGKPLDENCVLGSDGITYNSETLSKYQDGVADDFKNLSPLYPNKPDLFITIPDSLVHFMVTWIAKHQPSYSPPPSYQLSSTDSKISSISDQEFAKIEQLKERKAKRDQKKFQELKNFNFFNVKEIMEKRERDHAAFSLESERIFQELNRRLDENKNTIEEEIKDMTCDIEELNRNLKNLNSQVRALVAQVDRIHTSIQQTQQQALQLQISINEVKIAAKKRENAWKKDLLKAVAIIGVCAFSTWALQAALSSMGSSASVVFAPKPNAVVGRLAFPIG